MPPRRRHDQLHAAPLIGVICVVALGVIGCGSSARLAAAPQPATPVELDISVDNSRVEISPARIGAGPILLVVTNQASSSRALTIARRSGDGALAQTGPIKPDSTAQLQVDLSRPGDYSVSAGTSSPATLHLGAPRGNGDSALLQP